jgi:hypothetical protein
MHPAFSMAGRFLALKTEESRRAGHSAAVQYVHNERDKKIKRSYTFLKKEELWDRNLFEGFSGQQV